ncbi:MAG: phosphatidate cytidylyltransferase [candidate division NC10 bacterium]|nr:phosphatidate cytidylyltransferase [candidate division NC10 bacterium]
MADVEVMHRQRVLSALLLVPPFLLLVHFGSPLHFALLVSLVIGLAAWEFSRLCPAGTDPGLSLLTVLGGLAWHAALALHGGVAGVAAAVVGAALLRATLLRAEFRVGLLQAAWIVLGTLYVGGLLSFASLLRALPEGRQVIYYLAFTTWAGDIGAFYVGSRYGRRPLAARISPKKTVEGALGGMIATMLVAIGGSVWIWPRFLWAPAALVGLLLASVGILGDLCESAVKRAADAKDSGALIPGHGGVLDRLDSLMFAGPVLYALVRIGWV